MSENDTRPEERSEVEAHLRRLFTLSIDLMCVAGFDGYFKRVNPAFKRVLGYELDELQSRQFIDFVHPDDRASTLIEVESLSRGAVTADFENRYRTQNGEYRWLAWHAAPMVDQELIYAVARDVTREKSRRELLIRQAAELERSNADLEQFANVASHDLRAPLRSIVTLAGFVEHDLGEAVPAKTRGHLAELRRRAHLMKALIDDLLVYSEAGNEREEIVEVDVAALVRDVAFLLDPPDTFEIIADPSLPALGTLRGPLEQVLRNLIANAVKHHDRADGKVVVSARDTGKRWELAVDDDGPGMSESDREKVFRALEPLHAGESGASWGMGLRIVQRIVEHFGGSTRLEPAAKGGRGTSFRFDWPKRIGDEQIELKQPSEESA